MGVQGLWELLSPVGERVANSHVRHKRMAVDASIWLTQFVRAMREAEGAMMPNAHLLGIFRRCCKLLFLAVKPVLVFDGATPALKRRTRDLRRAQRDRDVVKLRRLAERLLSNQMKRAALRAVTDAAKTKQASRKRGPVSGGVSKRKTRRQSTPSPTLREDGVRVFTEPGPGYIRELDVMLDLELELEQKAEQGENPGKKDDAVYEEEEEEEKIRVELPEDLLEIDDEMLTNLPPNVQAEVFKQIRQTQRAHHRAQVMTRQNDPAEFSKAQIAGFMKNTLLNRRIKGVRKAINNKTGANNRIASDSARMYRLEENEDADDELDLDSSDGEPSQSVQRLPSPENQELDLLTRIRIQRERRLALSATDGEAIDNVPAQNRKKDDGLGWASSVLHTGGVHKLGALVDDNNLPDSSESSSDDRREAQGSVVHRGEMTAANRVDSDSDESMEWEDGATGAPVPAAAAREKNEGMPSTSKTSGERRVPEPIISSSTLPHGEEDIELQKAIMLSVKEQGVPGSARHLVNVDEDEITPRIVLRSSGYEGNRTKEDKIVVRAAPRSPLREHDVIASTREFETHSETRHIGEDGIPQVSNSGLSNPDMQQAILLSMEGAQSCRPDVENGEDEEKDQNVAMGQGNSELEMTSASQEGSKRLENGKSHVSLDSRDEEKQIEVISSTPEMDIKPVDDFEDKAPVTLSDAIETPGNEVDAEVRKEPKSMNPTHIDSAEQEREDIETEDAPVQPDAEVFEDDPAFRKRLEYDLEGFDVHPTKIAAAEKFLNDNENPETNDTTSGPYALDEDEIERLHNDLESERADLVQKQYQQRKVVESVTDEMLEESKDLLKLFGIPFVEAPMEAEAQCAFFELKGLVDGVITEDSDTFLFGANTVYRRLFAEGKFAEVYDAAAIKRELGIDREKLIRLAYLLGSDYTPGVRGIGIVNSMEVLEAFPGENGLSELLEWSNSVTLLDKEPNEETMQSKELQAVRRQFCWKHRNVKRNWIFYKGFPNPQVSDAYWKPVVHSSEEPFTWKPVDFAALERFCYKKFGWDSIQFGHAIGPLRQELHRRRNSGPEQRRIEEFFKPHRFAKIKSQRLQRAVRGIAGDRADKLMADPQKPKKSTVESESHSEDAAGETSEVEDDVEVVTKFNVDNLPAAVLRKELKRLGLPQKGKVAQLRTRLKTYLSRMDSSETKRATRSTGSDL